MEQMEYREEVFESTDADASFTTAEKAGHLHKGGFLMIRNRPCKIASVDKQAPGKHGHAKCHFFGKDLFTGDKMETVVPAGHNTDVPVVTRKEYMILYPQCVAPGCHVSLMDLATLTTRADLKLPEDAEMTTRIKEEAEDDDKEITVVVLAACGMEQIMDFKASKALA